MIDYHVHTKCSGDGCGSILEACAAAVSVGLTEICFTEHVDFEPTDPSFKAFDYALYTNQVDEAREDYADRLLIRLGVEIDFQDQYRSQIRDFVGGSAFDYVIGSAHYVGGVLLENHGDYFPGRSAEEAYAPFFDNTMMVVETGWFDTLAHLDLCKRNGVRYYGPFDCEPHLGQIRAILQAVIERNMTLEVNTSGLRQQPRDFYPCREIVECYYAMGGRSITVGSDAHRPEDVGSGIREAMDMLTSIGFDRLDTYEARRRTQGQI